MINNPKLVAQNIISVLILLYNEFQRNCTYPFWEFNSNSNIINTENANTDVSINDNVINNNIVNKIMILRTYYQKNYGLKFKNLFILRRRMRLIIIDMLKHSWMDQNV